MASSVSLLGTLGITLLGVERTDRRGLPPEPPFNPNRPPAGGLREERERRASLRQAAGSALVDHENHAGDGDRDRGDEGRCAERGVAGGGAVPVRAAHVV